MTFLRLEDSSGADKSGNGRKTEEKHRRFFTLFVEHVFPEINFFRSTCRRGRRDLWRRQKGPRRCSVQKERRDDDGRILPDASDEGGGMCFLEFVSAVLLSFQRRLFSSEEPFPSERRRQMERRGGNDVVFSGRSLLSEEGTPRQPTGGFALNFDRLQLISSFRSGIASLLQFLFHFGLNISC